MSDEELKQLIASNAKAIEALSAGISEMKAGINNMKLGIDDLKEEWQKDRRGIYQLLARLTRSQADFYETQSDFYRRFNKRQVRMLEILDRYLPPHKT